MNRRFQEHQRRLMKTTSLMTTQLNSPINAPMPHFFFCIVPAYDLPLPYLTQRLSRNQAQLHFSRHLFLDFPTWSSRSWRDYDVGYMTQLHAGLSIAASCPPNYQLRIQDVVPRNFNAIASHALTPPFSAHIGT